MLLIIVTTAGLFALGFGEYLLATGPWNRVFLVFKVPIVISLMFLIVRFIYAVTPRKSVPFRHTAAGAAFTSLGWAIATAIYSLYLKHFGNYDLYYGGLANVTVLIMWVYILSYIFIVGLALNIFFCDCAQKEKDT